MEEFRLLEEAGHGCFLVCTTEAISGILGTGKGGSLARRFTELLEEVLVDLFVGRGRRRFGTA